MSPTTFIYFIILSAALYISISCSSELSGKIVGGKEVGDKTRRFMVSLQIRTKHICSGFLATWRIVISTAFCIIYIRDNSGLSFQDADVFYGGTKIKSARRKSHTEKIREAKPHPNFYTGECNQDSSSDIGYALLVDELTMQEFDLITATRIKGQNIFPPMTASTYGWGSRKIEDARINPFEASMSEVAITMKIVIAEPDLCENAIGRKLKSDEFCASADVQGETCALGDAGNPLVLMDGRLAGIASIVNIRARDHPIVFIKIDHHSQYIEELNDKFPCKQPLQLTYRERRKLIKENKQSPASNEINKRLRCSNEQSGNLPDLNMDSNYEDEEENMSR